MELPNIGVIVAHPDDEVLAFGGTIAKYAKQKHNIHILILATGVTSRQTSKQVITSNGEIELLRHCARTAADRLGAKSVDFCDFPDNRMDTVSLLELVYCIEEFITRLEIKRVLTHYQGDLNIDHQITSRAVITACRSLPQSLVSEIYAGEVLSSSEYNLNEARFEPNTYIELGEELESKLKALSCYSAEMRESPHPRSYEIVKAQAILRGSEVGVGFAEALKLLRRVDKN